MAVAYLLQPAVAYINLEQFHPDSFEVPLVLLALYFMVRGRWKLFVGCVVALLLVKEDVALFTLPLGRLRGRAPRPEGRRPDGGDSPWSTSCSPCG